jgi:hypothetical protein
MPNVDEILGGAREAMSVKRVFGDPIESDGVTIVPVAKVGGGGGGGGDDTNNGGGLRADGEAGRRLRDQGRRGDVEAGDRPGTDPPGRPRGPRSLALR